MDISTRHRTPAVDGDIRRELVRSLALPVGGGVALGLPMFLSPLRSFVPHSLLVAVIGVVVVVTGFVGGRGAALTAAVVGALSFDAFLTETNGELRPDRMAFWTTLAVFVVAGVLASVLRPARH